MAEKLQNIWRFRVGILDVRAMEDDQGIKRWFIFDGGHVTLLDDPTAMRLWKVRDNADPAE